MRTSVIMVRDMLSVLSVDGVEQRIGEVPGVASVTVNYAAGTATVRYDETRLQIADIKSAVRQSGYDSAGESTADAVPASNSVPAAAAPNVAVAGPAVDSPKDYPAPSAPPSAPEAADPTPAPDPSAAVHAPADPAGEDPGTKAA